MAMFGFVQARTIRGPRRMMAALFRFVGMALRALLTIYIYYTIYSISGKAFDRDDGGRTYRNIYERAYGNAY